jgi:NAD(P)-dependent dehydrogenase (short-subunit alcohol dehydrogenase family)
MAPTTWFVTGASSGIGRAVTEQLLERGDRVAATARSPHRLDDLADAYGRQLWTAALDVTDTAALRALVPRVFAELGRVDVVLSNAGRGAFGAAEELRDDTVDEQIALNLTAPVHLLRAVLPRLRAQGGGRFIQTSSMGGQITTPGGSIYHASKWGLEGFFETVAGEVAPFGIGVTIVEPGIVRTDFGSALSIADPLDAYAETPVGQVRRFIDASGGNLTGDAPGDPRKVAAAIIDSARTTPAPRRLILGSDAYELVHSALSARLEEVRASRQLAGSTDFGAGPRDGSTR